MNRCCQIVFDKTKGYNRRCKKKCNYIVSGDKYCSTHVTSIFKNNITKIQSSYRGHRIRLKLKYFKVMPYDIQYKILEYMRDDFYNARFNCQISNYVIKKLKLYTISITNYFHSTSSLRYIHYLNTNPTIFVKCLKLLLIIVKYKSIIEYNPQYKKCIVYNNHQFTNITLHQSKKNITSALYYLISNYETLNNEIKLLFEILLKSSDSNIPLLLQTITS